MLRKVVGLTSVPFRGYFTDTPYDAPYVHDDHHDFHYPHVEEDTAKAWSELQTLLDTLPKRSYLPVVQELVARSKVE